MSKVLVDRELLERACMRPGRESLAVNDRDIIERGRAQSDIRELLAQPAEAEGVRDYLTEFAEGEVEAKTAIEELQDALSAVTAERDRLRDDAERYAHLKAAWDDDVLISYLDSNVHPSDWDSVIDAAMAAKEA